MTADIPRHLTTTSGVANQDDVLEIERLYQFGQIIRVGTQIVAVPWLVGSAVTAPVVRNSRNP